MSLALIEMYRASSLSFSSGFFCLRVLFMNASQHNNNSSSISRDNSNKTSTAKSRGSNHRGRYNPFLLGDTKESLIMSAYRIDITHEVKDICILLFI